MTQDDVYRRAGRGGAGNYVPAKKAAEADRDLEAQELSTNVAFPPSSSSPAPSHGGRGGAGNFIDPSQLPTDSEQKSLAARIGAKLKHHPARGGPVGRGGAGNWEYNTAVSEEERAEKERETGLKGEDLERKIEEDVDSGLKKPEKVHHGQEKKPGAI